MTVESATYLNTLVAANPAHTDPLSEADGHLRLLKITLQATFPNLTGPVTLTQAQINSAVYTTGGQTIAGTTTLTTMVVTAGSTLGGTTNHTGPLTGTTAVFSGAVSGSTVTASGAVSGATVASTAGVTGTTGTFSTSVSSPSHLKGGFELLPAGVGMYWLGSIASIPGGYHICDGTSGTPDLRDKFLVAAGGTYTVAQTGGATSVTLVTGNLPSHNHTGSDSGHTHYDYGHAHGISQSDHSHSTQGYEVGNYGGSGSDTGWGYNTPQISSGTYGAQANISINTGWANIANASAVITIGYTGSSTAFSILPPFAAYPFIMKL